MYFLIYIFVLNKYSQKTEIKKQLSMTFKKILVEIRKLQHCQYLMNKLYLMILSSSRIHLW